MVVDHVHDRAEAQVGQALDHLAELEDALLALRFGRVAALGHAVVERVIAPVEAIEVAHPLDDLLLLLARAIRGRQLVEQRPDLLAVVGRAQARGGRIGRAQLLDVVVELDAVLAALANRRDVEGRQQVHVRQACLLQLLQVVAAVRARFGEGRELALVDRVDERIVDAEVADVQLVHDDVLGRIDVRLGQVVPAQRLEVDVVQVHELAAHAVRREAHGIRVRDLVVHERIRGRREHTQVDRVVEAVPFRLAGDAPDTAVRVEGHRRRLAQCAVLVVDLDADARGQQRGRRPDLQAGHSTRIAGTEDGLLGGAIGDVDVV